jgi:hypothetical protein
MELCVKEANALIARSNLGSPVAVSPTDLPLSGKDKVIALLQFLVSSSNPFEVEQLNKLTGSNLTLPGPIVPHVADNDHPSIPFTEIEYYGEQDNLPQTTYIGFHNCP